MSRLRRSDWLPAIVLLVATLCLTLERGMSNGAFPPVPDWNIPYLSVRTAVYYVALPCVTLVLLGCNPLPYFGLGRWRAVIHLFGVGVLVMLALAGGLLTLPSARAYYTTGPGNDALLSAFFLMLCNEFFFRGFLLLPLLPRFGWHAAFISAMPYALLHVGKPLAETLGSIPYALALSYLAIRSGSVMYGVILHWVLAVGVALWVRLLASG